MDAPTISTPVLKLFRQIVKGYFRRHFHAVRASGTHRFTDAGAPLIVYANHGSWWDPMISILLAGELMPQSSHYAPMDADALARYGIFKQLGVFPVEMKSARGAVQFVRTGSAVLTGGGVLWVTPQGRFADARERPLAFKPGLAVLAARNAPCTVLPLAIEYPFWDERLPEALLHFGEPVQVLEGESEEMIQSRLERALEAAMEDLKVMAIGRNASVFTTLARGSAGTGGFYALGQRFKAMVRRRPYQAEHTMTHEAAGVRKVRE
jgi:1-acyl-sn-glycerol-3-phosphate acyltransferase